MKSLTACLSVLLCVGIVAAQQSPSLVKETKTPEVLKAEIEALKPAKHVWRQIAWKTCPLEALKASREENKPVIAWVYLGIPTDERC